MKQLFAILIIFLAVNAQAQVDLKKYPLPNKRIIRVTGHPDYPPVIWAQSNSKKLTGISVELIETIFQEIDVKVEFINVETLGRAQEEVKAGRIDMLLPPYKTDDRLDFYNYSADAFMMDETVVFVKKGKEFKFETFQDLLKHPGVAIINDSFGDKFDEFDRTNKNITRLPTTEQSFRFVDKNRARYVIAGLNSGMSAITKLKWEGKFVILPKRIIVTGLYAPISIKSPWNIPEINKFLKDKFSEYNRGNTIKNLEKKYLRILRAEEVPSQKP